MAKNKAWGTKTSLPERYYQKVSIYLEQKKINPLWSPFEVPKDRDPPTGTWN